MDFADEMIRDWPRAFGFENVEIGGADGTRLRLVMCGPKSGRPVVLLHGMPQLSYAWRQVMERLSGYRAIAVDLRGYGGSALPRSGRYDLEVLTEDLGIVLEWARARYDEGLDAHRGEAPSDRRALLVGHGWGASIAWGVAERRPDLLRHLVAVNGPHPGAFARAVTSPRQMLRSWYVGLFQVPFAELAIERTDSELLLWLMTSTSAPGTFSRGDLALYRAALSRPGRARAVLAYYRQALRKGLLEERRRLMESPRVRVPATVVWGEADRMLHPLQAEGVRAYAERVEVRRLPGVSHWVPEDCPGAIVQAVVDGDRDR
jgi:pimeloyl-ACP methyl ester carboxylesterase